MSAKDWIYLPDRGYYLNMSQVVTVNDIDDFDNANYRRAVIIKLTEKNSLYEFHDNDADAIMRYVQGLME